MTKVTIGFLSLILALGASLWIAEGVHLVSLEFPSSSLACSGPDESESKRYHIPWKIYVNGHAESAKTFAWHKVHNMITFFMGLLYVAINYLWWIWENGRVSMYTSGFTNRDITSIPSNVENRHMAVRTYRLNYVLRLLQTSSVNLNWYFAKYMSILFLTIGVIIAQLYYIHYMFSMSQITFDGYLQLYRNMMQDQHERMLNTNDSAVLKFPVTFCFTFKFWASGAFKEQEVQCDNSSNSWVEAFYITNIFVLYALIILWIVTFLQTAFALLYFKNICRITNFKTSKFNHFDYGKRLLFLFMAQNFEPRFWNEVILAINDSDDLRSV